MTTAFGTITEYMLASKAPLAEKRASAREELEKMNAVIEVEKGLLNHAQAGLVLGVSVKRVGELVRLGKLRRFDFLGRTYVSSAEILKRYDEEIAAGERVGLSTGQKLLTNVKATLNSDSGQLRWALNETIKERAEMHRKDKEIAIRFLKEVLATKAPPKRKVKK